MGGPQIAAYAGFSGGSTEGHPAAKYGPVIVRRFLSRAGWRGFYSASRLFSVGGI